MSLIEFSFNKCLGTGKIKNCQKFKSKKEKLLKVNCICHICLKWRNKIFFWIEIWNHLYSLLLYSHLSRNHFFIAESYLHNYPPHSQQDTPLWNYSSHYTKCQFHENYLIYLIPFGSCLWDSFFCCFQLSRKLQKAINLIDFKIQNMLEGVKS